MNPFDLRGPQFLLFYILLIAIVVMVVAFFRRRSELAGVHGRVAMDDPYLIAYLRGGKNEAIRTAIISLVDRGLLEVSGDYVKRSAVGAQTSARRTLEKELLECCKEQIQASSLFASPAFATATAELERQLAAQRLLPDHEIKSDRRRIYGAALAVLLLVAIAKIVVALGRGRTNVGFLIVLTIVALIVTAKAAFPRTTAAGKAFLAEVRHMFESLRLRSAQLHTGGASSEVALLVAVFGVSALSGDAFGWTKTLFPKAAQSSSSSCGSSCGGGCGGGCGGCGG